MGDDVLKELEAAGVIDYQEVYRRTKSHVKARAYVRAQSRQQRERNAAKNDHMRMVKQNDVLHEQARKREKTNGMPPISSPIEREKRRKKSPDLSKTTLEEFEFGELIRHALLRNELVLQWKDMSKGVPKIVLDTIREHGDELNVVRLSGNKLSTLPDWGKSNLPNLKVMSVSNNVLLQLPSVLGELDQLEELDVSSNRLTELPESIRMLTHLQKLVLSNNLLGSLPVEFGKMIDLQELNLSSNHLEFLPASFKRFRFLKRLIICRNKLGTLALIPKPTIADREANRVLQENKSKFKKVTMHGETVYFNEVTHETTRVPPKEALQDPWSVPACEAEESTLQLHDDPIDSLHWGPGEDHIVPKLNLTQLPVFAPTTKVQYQSVIEERKSVLISKNLGEWSFHLDLYDGRPVYTNNIFRTEVNQIPPLLDCFGEIVQLHVLNLSDNNLSILPDSFSKLVMLQKLDVSRNRLRAFPEAIMKLNRITVLNLSDNHIEWIPNTVTGITVLKKLNLARNEVYHIADEIGQLCALEELNLMTNQLEAIPLTIADLEKLKVFNYAENDILYPEAEIMSKVQDLGSLKYQLRQIRLRSELGNEPEVYAVAHGIEYECLDTNAKYAVIEQELINSAKESGVLQLHWRGLEYFPWEVFNLQNLTELWLIGNQIKHIPDEIESLLALRILELRNNGIETISDSIGKLSKLEVFSIQDNKVSVLPKTIGRLRVLVRVHLTNNLIEELPDVWDEMRMLQELHMESNRISQLPKSLGCVTTLRFLHVSCNKLTEIPDEISSCVLLERLHANQNMIKDIPDSLSRLGCLKVLRLGHNEISEFPECLGNGEIAKSLTELWLYSNKIVELSNSFQNMEKLKDVRLDFNPMRSPPMELSAKGVGEILSYCKARGDRIEEIKLLLSNSKFQIDPQNLIPQTQELLIGGFGYLSDNDRCMFDTYVDQYINADFYNCNLTGKQIVSGIADLRAKRQETFRRKLVLRLLMVLELLEDEELCSEDYFRPQVMLRWGTMLQKTDCFAITPDILFEAQLDPPHESIRSILDNRSKTNGDARDALQFHSILFMGTHVSLTREVVCDALETYKDPFGNPVGQGKRFVKFKKSTRSPNSKLPPLATSKNVSLEPLSSKQPNQVVAFDDNLKQKKKLNSSSSDSDSNSEVAAEEDSDDNAEADVGESKQVDHEDLKQNSQPQDIQNVLDEDGKIVEQNEVFSDEDEPDERAAKFDINVLEKEVEKELHSAEKKPGFFKRIWKKRWRRKSSSNKVESDVTKEPATAIVANPDAKVLQNKRSMLVQSKPKPGEKEAFVLRKLVYTQDEGEREKQEEADLHESLRKSLIRLEEWFQTKYARGKVKIEVKRRRDRERRKLQKLEKVAATAAIDLSNAQHALRELKIRRTNFKKQLPFSMHRFNNEQEMENLMKVSQDKVGKHITELEAAKLAVRDKKREPIPTTAVMIQDCQAHLKRKILARTHASVIAHGRKYAYQNNLRRPWDGRNGKDYQVWKTEQDKIMKDVEAALEDADEGDHDGDMHELGLEGIKQESDEDDGVAEKRDAKTNTKKFAIHDDETVDATVPVDKLVKIKYCWSSDEYSDDDSELDEE